jgi:4-amino-4-deoxy-L-arabinose transferase-like glycosyltransferase
VLLLHRLMRRAFGHGTALLAALMLALSPVSVVMARYNNPDALLALLLVAAAWALVRSLESARLRDIVLCGLFVGLAFNTKMLEAYLIVPGLAIAFLIGAQGSVRRRIGHLLAGGAVMGVVSVAWFGTMMLIPAANRPYVGDSTNNSWFQLIFGANGFSRVSGSGKGGFGRGGGGGGLGGATGPLRLLSTEIGGQIAWLLPLALLGVITVLWLRRRTPRSDLRRGTVIMLGLWMLAGYLVFSFSKGTFHSYYTSAIAPAVAALAAVALVALGQRARKEWGATITLALAVAGTAVLSYVILSRTPTFVPWLRWTILVAGPLAGTANLLVRLGVRLPRRGILAAALATAALALLGGPAAYSLATIGRGQTGSSPTAGPTSAETVGGFGGFGGGQAGGFGDFAGFGRFGGGAGAGGSAKGGGVASLFGKSANGTTRAPGATHGAGGFAVIRGGAGFGGRGGTSADTANATILTYLEAHRDGVKYLLAATGSTAAAPYALSSGDPVITMGGFMGADPAPTVAQLKSLVKSGQLRYVLTGGGGFGGGGGGGGGRGGGGFGARASGSSGNDVSTERTQWVKSNCKAVTVPGAGSSSGLYLCTPPDAK